MARYLYRVFVANLDYSLPVLAWFYNQRGEAENSIDDPRGGRLAIPVTIATRPFKRILASVK